MQIFITFICLILSLQQLHSESKVTPPSKSGSLVIYKDLCVVTLPVQIPEKKEYTLPIAVSVDPRSILFHQENDESPEYTIASVAKDNATSAADLILNSKSNFDGDINYSFSGLDWNMHYVVEVNEAFNEIIKFNGFIRIENPLGIAFKNMKVRLIDAQTEVPENTQTFSEYAIKDQQSIHAGSVVRIPWTELHRQKAEQDYRIDVGGESLIDLKGIKKQIPLQIWLRFKLNSDTACDLANGEITVYIRDNNNTLKFLGTSELTASKAGEEIQLAIPPYLLNQLKSSKDSPLSQIQGKLEQTEFKTLLTEKVEEAAYIMTIKNLSEKETTIKVMLPFGKNRGKVVRESEPHTQENASSVSWTINVKPKTESVLRYRVQLMKE